MKTFYLAFLTFLISSNVSAQVYQEKDGVKLYDSAEDIKPTGKAKYHRGILHGKPTPDMIRKDFIAGTPAFRSCHQTNLEAGGAENGEVVIHFTLDQKGKAYSPRVEGNAPESVKNCLIAVLVGLEFQPYIGEGEGEIEVKQPINFKAKKY